MLADLEKLVIHLATQYDQGEDCCDFNGVPVSDTEYDDLVRELRIKNPQSIAFAKGSTSPSVYTPSGELVKHNPPMTSIAKADGDKKIQIYEDWLTKCCVALHYVPDTPGLFAQSYKRDGVAVRIYYEKGKLVKAGLRPRDGVNGIDVTENIKYVKGVPTTLPKPWTLSVGGELECLLDDFEKVQKELAKAGKDLRKNPRNHTYGSINQQKDPSKTKDGRISFIAYNILNFDESNEYYLTEIERAKWCNQVLKIPHVRVEPHKFDDLQKLEDAVDTLPYEVDGIVLKVNNLEDQESLGNSGDVPTGDPRGALAWKFAEESKTAEVDHLEWNASRTGRVTPIAIFKKSISLAGTDVSKATCNNYGWVDRNEIGAGTIVRVIKAGKIIPKVIEVIANKQKISVPKNCPSCNEPLTVVDGHDINQELMCENQNCGAKHIKTYAFYLASLNAKGIGEAVLERMVDSGILKSLDQIYTLKVEDLIQTGEFTERQAILALATIHMVKPVKENDELIKKIEIAKKQKKVFQAWQFFGALGIPTAGKTAGKALIDHYGSFNAILTASEEDLVQIDGIGEKTAQMIVQWFKENKVLVQNLLQHVELELPKVGKMTGKSFCLTGSFPEGKSALEELIQDAGGKVSSSVGSKTDYVVYGDKAGSKLDAAKAKNIPTITADELKVLLK